MSIKKLSLMSGLVVSGIAVSTVLAPANAAVIITAQQTGSNVVFNYSGSINTTGISFSNSNKNNQHSIQPELASFVNNFDGTQESNAGSITGPSSFGSGSFSFSNNSRATGSNFGFNAAPPGSGVFYLTNGYISGNPLSGFLTFNNTTLAGLGVTPGTYIYNLSNGLDSITLTTNTSVPEPLNILGGMTALGLGGVLKRMVKKNS